MSDTTKSRLTTFDRVFFWSMLLLGIGLIWVNGLGLLFLGALWFRSAKQSNLRRRLGREPVAGPCVECGKHVGIAFRSDSAWRVAALAAEPDRARVLAARVCHTCWVGDRRWRCDDCAREHVGKAVFFGTKPPPCPHCGCKVTCVVAVPDELMGHWDQVRTWKSAAPNGQAVRNEADGRKRAEVARIQQLISGREGLVCEYIAGHDHLTKPMPAIAVSTPTGLVIARYTRARGVDASAAGMVSWPQITAIETEAFREGSDSSKLMGMMLATRPGSGALGAAVGLASLFAPGERTMHLVILRLTMPDGFETKVLLKSTTGLELAAQISAQRRRFLDLALPPLPQLS